MAKGSKRAGYSPANAQSPAQTLTAKGRDYAGFGGTDGVQSEASTSEARKFLDYDMDGDKDGLNIRNPGLKARYTKSFNAG